MGVSRALVTIGTPFECTSVGGEVTVPLSIGTPLEYSCALSVGTVAVVPVPSGIPLAYSGSIVLAALIPVDTMLVVTWVGGYIGVVVVVLRRRVVSCDGLGGNLVVVGRVVVVVALVVVTAILVVRISVVAALDAAVSSSSVFVSNVVSSLSVNSDSFGSVSGAIRTL